MYNWEMFKPLIIPDMFDTGYDKYQQWLKLKETGKENMNLDFIARLYEIFNEMKFVFNVDCKITSGYRSNEYNKAIGGADNSLHTKGLAADIYAVNLEKNMSNQLYKIIDSLYPEESGLGFYVEKNGFTFVHFDMRNIRSRWGRVNNKYVNTENSQIQNILGDIK